MSCTVSAIDAVWPWWPCHGVENLPDCKSDIMTTTLRGTFELRCKYGIEGNNSGICIDLRQIYLSKVITTMLIRPLDDPTWCAQSVVTDLCHGVEICISCNLQCPARFLTTFLYFRDCGQHGACETKHGYILLTLTLLSQWPPTNVVILTLFISQLFPSNATSRRTQACSRKRPV